LISRKVLPVTAGANSELFGQGNATDPAFINLRGATNEVQHDAKNFAERLWESFRPHADEHFLTEVRTDFISRFWEMYLTCALFDGAQKRGYRVTCPKPGPDVCVEFRGHRIWVEAIAATNGMPGNPNTLVEPILGGGTIPEDKIVLRYTSAILEKYRKYTRYIQSGIVDRGDAYIIAINESGLAFRGVRAEADLPRFLKALYPIGQLEVVIDLQKPRHARMRNRSRFTIRKANSQEVAVQTFIDTSWSGLSAVICSNVDVRFSQRPLGADFEIAYNPLAVNRAQSGLLPAGREWFSTLDGEIGELLGVQTILDSAT
jgi:hypothetical protein